MCTHNILLLKMKKKITIHYSKSAAKGIFPRAMNGLETAVVNEPSVFVRATEVLMYKSCIVGGTLVGGFVCFAQRSILEHE